MPVHQWIANPLAAICDRCDFVQADAVALDLSIAAWGFKHSKECVI